MRIGGGGPRIGSGGRGRGRYKGRGRYRGRGRGEGRGDKGEDKIDPNPTGFPILYDDTTATMKNISPSILPNFHGLRIEDPQTLFFEFEVLCKYFNYFLDSQKLKLFLAKLKGKTLKWFMGLIKNSIRTWEEMETTLLSKYKDYCIPHNRKDEVLK